jgi:DNA-binding Lrp family transcriptional regulator
MPDGAEPAYSAFVFFPDADPGLIDQLRNSGMPPGVRYVASVTGSSQVIAVLGYDVLTELPAIIRSLSEGDSTAVPLMASQIRKSEYLDETAFVRIHTKVDDPETLLAPIREAIGSEEADVVFGDFDILACVVGNSIEDLKTRVIGSLRGIDGIGRTETLLVIDYVSLSENAPDGHQGTTKSMA